MSSSKHKCKKWYSEDLNLKTNCEYDYFYIDIFPYSTHISTVQLTLCLDAT